MDVLCMKYVMPIRISKYHIDVRNSSISCSNLDLHYLQSLRLSVSLTALVAPALRSALMTVRRWTNSVIIGVEGRLPVMKPINRWVVALALCNFVSMIWHDRLINL